MTAVRRAGATEEQFRAMASALNRSLPKPLDGAELRRALSGLKEATGGPFANKPASLHFRTAKELCETQPEAVHYVVRPYVPLGTKISIDGAVKDGKTTFVLAAIVRPAVTGADALGFGSETAVPIVYCTEQPDASFGVSLREAGLDKEQQLHVLRIHDVGFNSWPETAAAIIAHAQLVGAKLIVIDTFSRWARLRGDDENSSGATTAALEALDPAIAAGISVLLVRHTRKGGGDIAEAARGSSAIAGEVDVILGLRKKSGRHGDPERVVEAIGRVDEIPERLTVRLVANPPTPGDREWRLLGFEVVEGTGDATEAAAKQQLVLDALKAQREPVSIQKLMAATRLSNTTLRRVLSMLKESGAVVSAAGGGERGTALLYSLPSATSHQLPNLGGGDLASSNLRPARGDVEADSPGLPESGTEASRLAEGEATCEDGARSS